MITTQGRVTAPNCGYPGDPYNTAVINQGLVQAKTAINGGVKIGKFCFGIIDSGNVQQLYVPNVSILAGFVIRAQNTPMPWGAINEGASMIVSDGLQANFVNKGTFIADVISANDGGIVKVTDKVYVRLADSLTVVSSTPLTDGYMDTGWVVTKTNPGTVNYSGLVVVISNEQTFN